MKEGELWFPYWGACVIKSSISNTFRNKLLEEGKKTKTDFRQHLAGMIEKEYKYKNYEDWFFPEFFPFLQMYQDQFINSWGGQLGNIINPFKITS